jgi:hypothetical protein
MAIEIKNSSDFNDRMIGGIIGCQEIFYARLKESLPADKQPMLDSMFEAMNFFAQDCEECMTALRNEQANVKWTNITV